MKNLLLLLFCVVACSGIAQDTIRFLDGTKQNARVEEVNSTTIKFKKADNLDGPVFSVPINRVYMVVYQNGSRDFFNASKPGAEPRPEVVNNSAVNAVPVQTVPSTPGPVKFGGPRVGCTYIGPGTSAKWITDQGKTPFVSQFGWQFETRIFSSSAGITGLVEFVPLIAGLEQGMILPSASLLFGLRGKEGVEFAVGPNISLTGFGMVFAAGASFHLDDVYFPVNIAFVPSVAKGTTTVSYTGQKTTITEHTGHRITLLIGFNTRKRY